MRVSTDATVLGVLVLDWLRVLTVVCAVVCVGGFTGPILSGSAREARRVWLLILSVWLFILRGALAAVSNLGEPSMPLLSTPEALLAGLVGVVYVAVYRRDVRRGQKLAAVVADSERRTRAEQS